MFIKLLIAGLLVLTTLGIPNALELIVAYIGFYSFAFYYTTWRIFVGLLSTKANTEYFLEPFTTILINSTALFTIYHSGQYVFMVWLSLPFVIITIVTFIFSLLLAKGYINIVDAVDEEEDE